MRGAWGLASLSRCRNPASRHARQHYPRCEGYCSGADDRQRACFESDGGESLVTCGSTPKRVGGARFTGVSALGSANPKGRGAGKRIVRRSPAQRLLDLGPTVYPLCGGPESNSGTAGQSEIPSRTGAPITNGVRQQLRVPHVEETRPARTRHLLGSSGR
jgi:hypothetical protein